MGESTSRKYAGLDLVGRSCEELCSECEVSSAHTQDNIETILASNLFGKQGQFTR